jgi:hypothetical protein
MIGKKDPTDLDLEQLEEEIEQSIGRPDLAYESPLEDLYTDAQLARKIRKPKRDVDPSVRNSLEAATQRMKQLYTNPENWVRTRGVALIDKGTQTLIGNFSEYVHKTVTHTRKLIREHVPIAIAATEIVEGYLGEALESRLRGNSSWTEHRSCQLDILFPELMVGAPNVKLRVALYLGGVSRAELVEETQFASMSGNTMLILPAGTNVLEQMGIDCKKSMKMQIGL